jgi:hypothetical protein
MTPICRSLTVLSRTSAVSNYRQISRYSLPMSRKAASFTQADVARVLRAAQQVGAKRVEVKVGDATVTVSFDNDNDLMDDRPAVRL